MAIRFPTTADYLSLTGASLAIDVDGSIFLQGGTLDDGLSGSEHQTLFAIFTGGMTDFSTAYVWLGFRANGADQVLFLEVWNGTDPAQSIEWVWAADGWVSGGIGYTYDAGATEFELFVNGVSQGTATMDMTGLSATALVLGSDVTPTADTIANPWVAYLRVAASILTGGQFSAEAASRTAVAMVAIGLTPLEYADEVGAWTVNGAPATTGGPIDIDNNTAATATAITSLPYSIVADIAAHATDNEAEAETGLPGYCAAWWSFTTEAPCTLFLGVCLTSTTAPVAPNISVLSGSPGSLAIVQESIELTWNGSEYVGTLVTYLSPSVTYYILAEASDDGPESGGVVELSVERQPNAVIPTNSIAITLSTEGGAIWFIRDTAPIEVLSIRHTSAPPTGEGNNDVKSDGTFILQKSSVSGKSAQLYGADLSLAIDGIVTLPDASFPMTASFHSPTALFYLPIPLPTAGSFQTRLTEVDLSGALTGNTWTFPAAPGPAGTTGTSYAVSVNTAVSIAYYRAGNTSPHYRTVRRWNLLTDSAMTDLVVLPAPVSGAGFVIEDILVIPGGQILVAAAFSGTPSTPATLFKYSTTGTLLGTCSLGFTNVISMAQDGVDPTAVWVGSRDPSTTHKVWKILTDTMTASETIEWAWATDEEPPFEPDFATPLFVTREQIAMCGLVPPPAPGTERAIRRERIVPLPSSERNFSMHIPELEVLLQPGIGDGDPTSQGVDPQVMLSISKDGGKTYGPEQTASAGAQGEYTQRVRFRRTPNQYRNGAVKVAMTDPVDWTLVDIVTPKIEEGTS